MTSAEIRAAYLKFFERNGHAVKPSTPLIPQGDASLMFNSAGMVPFKPYFLGIKKDLSRAASCQKCFRTTDIDRVGTTIRHMTFFEMLGNFSFGDYFKEESIAWAWEFMTDEMGFDPKRLYPTVFKEDDEADRLWRKLGPPNAPTRLGEDSNFWNMGPTGPCGPCSEIYFDRGSSAPGSCGKPSCAVGCDCDRYLEVWNLVFTQFDRQADGSLANLPRKNIDTGMGLERLTFTAEGKLSPFETDLFLPIVTTAMRILGVDRNKSPETALAYRVIADHARAATMLMSEGIIPSNVERGYVLRRLIRRALRYGQLLGHRQPFLHRLVPSVVEIFEQPYPDVKDAVARVQSTLKTEEEKFLETLEKGEKELAVLLESAGKTLDGAKAFMLYETFGFPLELTREIAGKQGIAVDEKTFEEASKKASDVARASWKGSGETSYAEIGKHLPPSHTSEFIGYEMLESPAEVVAFAELGPEAVLVLDKTPFYPEGGGQVGDEGSILSADGKTVLAKVADTQRQGAVIVHKLTEVRKDSLHPTTKVIAKVDAVRRNYIAPHHTATHLLNEALRRHLGEHVHQAGSYVGPDKLRLDFTNPKAIDRETLVKIQATVEGEIRKRDMVTTRVEPIAKVKEYGAVTLPGENYGEMPRFVLIGPKGWADCKDRYSLELCGGTHVGNTGDIAAFKILKESSVAAGVRRIEALAGKAVDDFDRLQAQESRQNAAQLRVRERELLEQIAGLGGKADESPKDAAEAQLRVREKELKELLGRLRQQNLSAQSASGATDVQINGVKLRAQKLDGADPKSLRGISDKFKAEVGSGLVFLATPTAGKLSFILAATPDLAAKGVDAAKIAKAFAAARGGSAGGRADFAQGGAPDGDWQQIVDALAGLIKS